MKLLKITKRNTKNPDLLLILLELCKSIIQIGVSTKCLKNFICLLNIPIEEIPQNENVCNKIISSLSSFIKTKCQRKIFIFTGKSESGIGLTITKNMPIDGYGFCGYIRIERKNQARNIETKHQTIYKLGSSVGKGIELFLKDGLFHYKVNFKLYK